MKLYRIAAIMERDMRKFFRNPMLMIATMVFPLTHDCAGVCVRRKISRRWRWSIRTAARRS